MLNNSRHILLVCLVVLCVCAVSLPGCRGSRTLTTTVKDSVATQTATVYRDTTIYIKGDTAGTVLGTDWTAMHHLLAALKAGPKVVERGPAKLVITQVAGTDSIRVDAVASDQTVKLDSAIQHIRTLTYQLRTVQQQVEGSGDRFRLPGWAKGIALVAGSLAVLLLLITLLPTLKHLFHAKA